MSAASQLHLLPERHRAPVCRHPLAITTVRRTSFAVLPSSPQDQHGGLASSQPSSPQHATALSAPRVAYTGLMSDTCRRENTLIWTLEKGCAYFAQLVTEAAGGLSSVFFDVLNTLTRLMHLVLEIVLGR
jgi:hypothetical protein